MNPIATLFDWIAKGIEEAVKNDPALQPKPIPPVYGKPKKSQEEKFLDAVVRILRDRGFPQVQVFRDMGGVSVAAQCTCGAIATAQIDMWTLVSACHHDIGSINTWREAMDTMWCYCVRQKGEERG
jgi:hypothetical protein